jgi:hypothetical protein
MTSLTDAQTTLLATAAGAPGGVIDRDGDPRTIASLVKKSCLIALPQADGPGRLLITTTGRQALDLPAGNVASPPAATSDCDAQETERLVAGRSPPSAEEPPAVHDEPEVGKHEAFCTFRCAPCTFRCAPIVAQCARRNVARLAVARERRPADNRPTSEFGCLGGSKGRPPFVAPARKPPRSECAIRLRGCSS